tara:strand:- start:323 stop:640 length:318 start_codon:yes stop_codon:yes gene_type:complete
MKKCLFIILIALFSCTNSENQKHLSKDKFMKVYGEIMTLESYYKMNFRSPNIYKDSLIRAVDKVLLKNNVSFEEFDKTYVFYSAHQEEFQELNNVLIEHYSQKKL